MTGVEVTNLKKKYGEFTAVKGSTFSVDEGEVFGVVGPNGAGKTTTLKMLAGLIEPTSGSATVAGYDITDSEMRKHLGFLPEGSPLYDEMTAHTYLNFFADLYNVPDDVADDRIDDVLTRLDLTHRDRRIGNMSKGMTRKVAIARSLINDPSVVIYDEPASGLDPKTTHSIIQFTKELKEDGKTIIFSAHNLYHVESVCDRVAVMNEGEIVAQDTIQGLRDTYGSEHYTLTLSDPVVDDATPDENGTYTVEVPDMDAIDAVREQVADAGGDVLHVQPHTTSLEDIFLSVTGTVDGESSVETPAAQSD